MHYDQAPEGSRSGLSSFNAHKNVSLALGVKRRPLAQQEQTPKLPRGRESLAQPSFGGLKLQPPDMEEVMQHQNPRIYIGKKRSEKGSDLSKVIQLERGSLELNSAAHELGTPGGDSRHVTKQ